MGDICNKFLLVVFHIPELGRHIVEGCGKISHLVFGVDRYLVIQIAGSILLGGFRDLAERPVNEKLERQQNHKGQNVDDEKARISCIQKIMLCLGNTAQVFVDDQISLRSIVTVHRCNDREYIFIKVTVVITDLVLVIANFCRIKVRNSGRSGRKITGGCRSQHFAVAVNKPACSIQMRFDTGQLQMNIVERNISIKILR